LAPFNISAVAEASEFKFGVQLGFAKAHLEITRRGKSACGPGLGELPNILGPPFNISATAEASDFKFIMQLEFAKSHHKIPPRRKVARGAPKNLGFSLNIYAMAEGIDFKFGTQSGWLIWPIIKSHK